MAILPKQRPMSMQYAVVTAVLYLALGGYVAYRGYIEHKNVFYVVAAVAVIAAVIRIARARKVAGPPNVPPTEPQDKKVELFSKPKDY